MPCRLPISQLYRENVDMLRSMAWKYTRATGLPYDTFFAEAQYIFCRAVEKYDDAHPSASKFSHYLYNQLHALTHIVEKANSAKSKSTSYLGDALGDTSGDDSALTLEAQVGCTDFQFTAREVDEYLVQMSPEAQQLVDWQMFGELDPPPTAKAKKKPLTAWSVFQRRTSKEGWTWPQTQKAFTELQDTLSAYIAAADLEEVL